MAATSATGGKERGGGGGGLMYRRCQKRSQGDCRSPLSYKAFATLGIVSAYHGATAEECMTQGVTERLVRNA